jgi:hypothetical protein
MRALLHDFAQNTPVWQWPLIALLLVLGGVLMGLAWICATLLDFALRICGSDPKELDEAQRILTSSPSPESHQETPRP